MHGIFKKVDVNPGCKFTSVVPQSDKSMCLCQVLCSNSVLDSSEYWLKNDKALCRIGFLEDQHDGGCPTVSLSHISHALRRAETIVTHISIRVINARACLRTCDRVEVRGHLYCVQPPTDKCGLDWGDNAVWCWLWLNNKCSNSLNWENTFSCTRMTAAQTAGRHNYSLMTDYIPHFTLMTSFLSRVNDGFATILLRIKLCHDHASIFAPWWWNTTCLIICVMLIWWKIYGRIVQWCRSLLNVVNSEASY